MGGIGHAMDGAGPHCELLPADEAQSDDFACSFTFFGAAYSETDRRADLGSIIKKEEIVSIAAVVPFQESNTSLEIQVRFTF